MSIKVIRNEQAHLSDFSILDFEDIQAERGLLRVGLGRLASGDTPPVHRSANVNEAQSLLEAASSVSEQRKV